MPCLPSLLPELDFSHAPDAVSYHSSNEFPLHLIYPKSIYPIFNQES